MLEDVVHCRSFIFPCLIAIPASYTGPVLAEDGSITFDFIMSMIDHFKNQKTLAKQIAFKMCLDALKMLKDLPSLVDIQVPKEGTLTVCGTS